MKIGFDIDGVLANFTDPYAALLTKYSNGEFRFPLNSDKWPTVWFWEREAGVSKALEKQVWQEITNSAFWAELPTLPGAVETLDELRALRFSGHHVYFITSRPGRFAKLLTEQWLMRHGLSVPTVIIANAGKGDLARGLELDVFVDDKPENCQEVFNARLEVGNDESVEPQCRVFLVDAPYNRGLQFLDPRIERVQSGLEAVSRVVERDRVGLPVAA